MRPERLCCVVMMALHILSSYLRSGCERGLSSGTGTGGKERGTAVPVGPLPLTEESARRTDTRLCGMLYSFTHVGDGDGGGGDAHLLLGWGVSCFDSPEGESERERVA